MNINPTSEDAHDVLSEHSGFVSIDGVTCPSCQIEDQPGVEDQVSTRIEDQESKVLKDLTCSTCSMLVWLFCK